MVAAASRTVVSRWRRSPAGVSTTISAPSTRTCASLPKNGVPKPPRVQRSPILPLSRWRTGEITRSATACSAPHVAPSVGGTGSSGLYGPSQRSLAQSGSTPSISLHIRSPLVTGETTSSGPSGGAVGSSANHGSSCTAGGDGSSTHTS